MNQKADKVCGLDVHKRFVMAAIMIKGVTDPIIERFSTDGPGLPIARLARRAWCPGVLPWKAQGYTGGSYTGHYMTVSR